LYGKTTEFSPAVDMIIAWHIAAFSDEFLSLLLIFSFDFSHTGLNMFY
jgi:hypothetical protein